ncbi:PstS family phosphate ABC transporter substrate-binding protein [Halobacterium salinarum]|uniref:Phosphate transport system substrate-binding protein n=3 Tax=Halobacterium salinarum TaxID=2242 RepID=A0A841H9A7_HALSI|nr:substrate-binding domain-containing protein [Halobacterium salinarum]AAG20556.1 phosphate ABC transporter binding [Halobacterium salinarum NRC-1]MBB6089511.1 phosphate transport system substrate-binding protein [Halobacterium salinarum]MDL0131732.1 substrate-binding domain-containing protein [Halobacterium salinarum]MDL0141402.1 substrate-binding domain-containing protein [Halobacterium salinarum]UEB91909.1 substrate-binding domain-containing protein [Halobacterium salinarum NRC-34001]
MHSDPDDGASGPVSRRAFVAATGTAGVAALAGCANSTDGSGGDGTEAASQDGDETASQSSQLDTSVLTGDGSSTVFPITNEGSSYWNSNPEAGDEDYWPEEWANEYDTEMRLADYFASEYGYEAGGERSSPPFRVSIALSHSGTGIEGVMEDRVDIGDASASAADELPDADSDTLDGFVDHVVGVDGQPIVASREIVDSGVETITIEELRGIYRQEITNWSELGGPDRDILALGRAQGSGTDTSFRANVFGDPEAAISPDQRYGQNQQLQQAIGQADNAIGYIALAFVQPDGDTPPLDLEIDGTTYAYGENLGAEEYPLSRDLHAYTWQDTSRKEAAFINFLLSEFGQEKFVTSNDYFALPESRLSTEREKVAASNYQT